MHRIIALQALEADLRATVTVWLRFVISTIIIISVATGDGNGSISHKATVPCYDVCKQRLWLVFGHNAVLEVLTDCLVQGRAVARYQHAW